MNTLQWTSDLEIGIPPIDKQHRRIVEYINQLEHAKENNIRSEVGEVVGQLVERFKLEEDITDELLVTLRTWLVNHIRNDDKDYSDAVKTKMQMKIKKEGWLKRSLGRFFG